MFKSTFFEFLDFEIVNALSFRWICHSVIYYGFISFSVFIFIEMIDPELRQTFLQLFRLHSSLSWYHSLSLYFLLPFLGTTSVLLYFNW